MLDLKAVGSSVEESEMALAVLAGLPKQYEVAVGVLKFVEDFSLDGLLPRLLQVEQRQEKEELVPIYGAGAQSGSVIHDVKLV